MIRDHSWRPLNAAAIRGSAGPAAARPCQYMNCRKPRRQHARAVVLHPTSLS